jgi:amphi-Trp domain-containing protein
MDTDKIEMKTLMDSAAVADYLIALAKGFKDGCIVVEKDGEKLTLTPAETAEVEVEARMKKDKARFSLEVTWRMAQPQDGVTSLKISSGDATAAKTEKVSKEDKPGKVVKVDDKKPASRVVEVKKADPKKDETKKPESTKTDSVATTTLPAKGIDMKPAVTKPAETKPAENKPVMASTPANTFHKP